MKNWIKAILITLGGALGISAFVVFLCLSDTTVIVLLGGALIFVLYVIVKIIHAYLEEQDSDK